MTRDDDTGRRMLDPARRAIALLVLLVLLALAFGGCTADSSDSTDDTSSTADTHTSSPDGIAPPPECDPPASDEHAYYSADTGRCYYFLNIEADWTGAEAQCVTRFGGHLATVANLDEHLALSQLLQNTIESGFNPWQAWIGLRSEDGATWAWSDTDLTEVWADGWHPGQPNGDPPPLCAYAYRTSAWKWHDDPCSKTMPVVCQK